jgi:hypothetical protein
MEDLLYSWAALATRLRDGKAAEMREIWIKRSTAEGPLLEDVLGFSASKTRGARWKPMVVRRADLKTTNIE